MKYLISLAIYFLLATPAFAQFDFFNQPPTIDKIKDFTTFENSGAQKIVLTGISPGRGESNQTVTIKAFSNNLNLINHPKIEYDQSTTAILFFTPKSNNSGKATITVELDDGQNWNNITETSFDIKVKFVNSPPSFKLSTNLVSVDEDKGKTKIKKFATQIDDGDPDKKQNLAFVVTLKKSDNSLSFKSSPKIDVRSGDLSFEADNNKFGKATFTVILKDDGGTKDGGNDTSPASEFTISVKNINDPPTLAKINPVTINEDSGEKTVGLTGISSGVNESQKLSIKAISDNQDLIASIKVEYAQGKTTAKLKFTPKANASGKAKITVSVDDGQESQNIIKSSFVVTVNSVNDKPTFKLSANAVNIEEGKGKIKINAFATNINDGDPETNQNLTFIVTLKSSTNNLTFKTSPAINIKSGDLTFEANNNRFGTATFTAVLKDDGGTKNGGLDTSSGSEFTITVKNINDPPTLANINPVTVNEDSGEKSVGLTGISSGANESQKLTIKAISDKPTLITNIKIAYTQGKTTATLKFTPKLNLFGTATITVTVNDGQSKNNTVSKKFSVTVNPVADTPKVTNAIVKNGKQTTSGLVISRNTSDGNEVTHFKITSISNGKLYHNDGKTQIANNKFITFKQGNSGLKFTPKSGTPANGSFKIQAATGATDNNLGGGVITAKISIDNAPPVITSKPVVNGEVTKFYKYDVKATDPNALDKLSYIIVIPNKIKPWLKSTDNNNGTARIFGTPPSGTEGLYKISIKVKDQLGKSTVQNYNLRVNKLNQKPVLTPLSVNIQEDDSVSFSFEDFNSHYKDPEGDAMKFIKIASLPQYGALSLDGVELIQNDSIEVEKIDQFKYIPDPNYFGLDIFDWNASDGSNFAQVPKRVSVIISSVNDVPEILDFEDNPFVFEFGNIGGISLTDSGRVVDVDGDKLEKVTVSISENYLSSEDSLYYELIDGLTYKWADSAGVLTIRGIETASIYQDAVRSLQYINLNRLSPTGSYRKIDIVLHDPDTFSLPFSRIINFENTFVDLDIPNGFTPNDDGVNDTWNIKNLDRYEDFHIAVFSRTGQEIFKSDNYYLNEWDGSYNGEPVPTGTYYYLITLNKFQKVFKGALFVLK